MKKYSKLGITGLVLGIIAIFCLLSSIPIPTYDIFFVMLFFLSFILGVFTIIIGAVTYLGKRKDKMGLADFIIGFIIIIIWIVTYIYISSTAMVVHYGSPLYRPKVE